MAQEVSNKLNIIVVGDFCIGKTALIKMYSEVKYQENPVTIGHDFVCKNFTSEAGEEIRIRLWDGVHDYLQRSFVFYRNGHGFVVVFDVTNQESFKNVRLWMDRISENACADIIKVLVGNKIDLEQQRQISKQDAEELAAQYKMDYYESSAKMNTNVAPIFENMATQIYRKRLEAQPTIQTGF